MKRILCALLLASGCHNAPVRTVASAATVAPALLAFGSVDVGKKSTLTLVVTNDSLFAVNLLSFDLPAPFTVSAGPQTIEASSLIYVDVVFAPQGAGDFQGSLTLQLSATDTPTLSVQLTGTGVAVPPQTCETLGCPQGQGCCNSICVDIESDASHCGSCTACATGQTCNSGTCVTPPPPTCDTLGCPSGQGCCASTCVDIEGDPAHCGSCTACAQGQTCNSGACVTPPPPTCDTLGCPSGQGCCSSTCVDIEGDPAHCGSCTACAQGQTCNSGTCVTPPPPTCDTLGCPSGQGCCNHNCVDIEGDPSHCGSCTACAAGDTCASGVCKVPPPPGCDDVTNPCASPDKCCNHTCVDVSQTGGLCPCKGTGGTIFAAGTLVIPEDICWQRGKDVTATPGYCDANAVQTSSDAPMKAYGLVFFLLRHQVTVYTAINPAKTSPQQIDLSLDSMAPANPVLTWSWATNSFVGLPNATTAVSYRGAPFLIDASEHDKVVNLLATDPDFAQFRNAGNITIHSTNVSFQTVIAKSITSVPSQIALLVPPGDNNTNVNILVRYLASAGLNFSGAGGTPAAHGVIYDQLQQSDFLPDYAHSNLKAGGYRLLWSPHWDGGTDSNTVAQLATIGSYVRAGNDLFAECAAIGTLEGMPLSAQRQGGGAQGQPGSAATRFMSSGGYLGNVLPFDTSGSGEPPPFAGPPAFTSGGLTSQFAQRGDFPFVGVFGAITDYFPNTAGGSSWNSGVTRYINSSYGGNNTTLLSSISLASSGGGTVVYLAGHDYSYKGDNDNAGEVGITAGSRLVLNTMFSLGTNNICAP